MRKLTQLLFLALVAATVASAQFTMTFGTDVESDGENVYETVTMDYAPNYGCTMCVTAGHTYSGSMVIQSSLGPTTECDYNASGSGAQYQYLGCEAVMAIDPNNDANYQGFVSAKNICSMIGTFLYIGIQQTQLTSSAHSAYKELRPCINTGPVSWVCNVVSFGAGCPGKCTKLETSKVVTPGSPQGFEQCLDVLIAGACGAQLCKSQTDPGFCTNGYVN